MIRKLKTKNPIALARRCVVVAALLAFTHVAAKQADAQQLSYDGKLPSSMAPGAPAGSYKLTGIDTVNPYNGQVNIAVKLLHIGGRGEAGFDIVARITNPSWRVETTIDIDTWYSYASQQTWEMQNNDGFLPVTLPEIPAHF